MLKMNNEELSELDFEKIGPLVNSEEYNETPQIPYKEKVIKLERNLLPGTLYSIGTLINPQIPTANLNKQLSMVLAVQNNQTELLVYIINSQIKADNLIRTRYIEKQTNKLSISLEQSKQDIEKKLEELEELIEEKYNKIINVMTKTEQKLDQSINEIKQYLRNHEKKIILGNEQNIYKERIKDLEKRLKSYEEDPHRCITLEDLKKLQLETKSSRFNGLGTILLR